MAFLVFSQSLITHRCFPASSKSPGVKRNPSFVWVTVSTNPAARGTTTGVPQACDSSTVLPSVSNVELDTCTSADARIVATVSWSANCGRQ